jgi:transcription initiation factor TFIIB
MEINLDKEWTLFEAVRNQQAAAAAAVSKKLATTRENEYICKCGGLKILNDDDLPTCRECGVVQSMYISDKPEWISSVDETGKVTDRARCGISQDLELFSSKWGYGSTLEVTRHSSKTDKRISMINFHQSMNHKDRALYHAYKDIEIGSQGQNLPDGIIRNAKILYRQFNVEKLTRGAVRLGIKANCVLYACKLAGYSRTTQEIADSFGIPTKDISRTAQLFKDTITSQQTSQNITKPSDIVLRLLTNFDIESTQKKILKIKCTNMCKNIEENCVEVMGKTPGSIASVVIYIHLKELFSKGDICSKCNISIPTLTKIENIINSYLEKTVV